MYALSYLISQYSCHVEAFGELIYPEFPFEGEAKLDGLIGLHQTKTVEN